MKSPLFELLNTLYADPNKYNICIITKTAPFGIISNYSDYFIHSNIIQSDSSIAVIYIT